jgi:hypothetical protein
MSFSLILIGLSLALFAYWFRYSCLLILRTQTAEDYSREVCRANGLSFDLVKGQIEAASNPNLSALYESLERDYRVVSQLLDQVSMQSQQDNVLETKLLRANFRATQAWFLVSHKLGLKSSASALEEMAETIGHFANAFGEQSAAGAGA